MLEPGEEIAGLRIVREVGRGTTSLVYEAESITGGSPAAIKLLLPGLAGDQVARARFLRGGEAQASLSHPGVVPVLDRGEDEDLGPYLVMPLYRDGSLSGRLASGGIGAADLLDLLEPVAAGLDSAHAAGIVHRDIKPSNILIDGDTAALADFGLAREEGEAGETVTGAVIGTLTCIAPEVVTGQRSRPASDRYGFAAVVVEALTGATVFPRTSDAAILYAHAQEEPPVLSQRRPDLPAATDEVFAAALAKDPGERPGTAAEFLERFRTSLGDSIGTLGPVPRSSGPQADDETVEPTIPVHRKRRLTRGAVVVLGVAVVAVLVGGALLLGGEGDPSSADAGVPPLKEGHIALGSDLDADGVTSTDCDGRTAGPNSPACTVMQLKLPGQSIQVPTDGAIRSWSVRGAEGELALQVLRERDGKFFQMFRSQSTVIPDKGVQTHAVELSVGAGDVVGLAVSPDTAVGIRKGVSGATTNRFFGPVGPDVPPSKGPGTGFDNELMLRVDYEPGGVPVPPEQIIGEDARDLPDGNVVGASDAALPDGRIVKVELVEVGDEVFVDLYRDGVRRSRIVVPDLISGGQMVEFEAYESPGNPSQLNVGWLNEGDRRPIEHYFGLDAESLEFYS